MVVYIGVLAITLGTGIVMPVIPLYARSLGASYMEVGLLGTSYSLIYVMLAVPSGWLSDRIGRKVIIAISASLCVLAAVLYLSASNIASLLLIRVIEGGAWCSFWPALEALVTEVSGELSAGKAMGICSASYGVGSLIGSVLGGFVMVFFGFQAAFLLYFCLSVMATLILANVKVRKAQGHIETQIYEIKKSSGKHSAATLSVAYIVSFSYTMLLAVMLTLFPVYAEDLKIEAFWIGVLLAALWLGRVVFFIYAGRLSDILGRENILMPAVACLSVASLIIAASSDVTPLFVANLLIGSGLGAAFPVTIALISDVTPSHRKGIMMGLFETFCGIGMFAGSTIGGWIAEIDARYPYILCGVVCAVCTSIVMLYRLKTKNR
jgi:MFS family permease